MHSKLQLLRRLLPIALFATVGCASFSNPTTFPAVPVRRLPEEVLGKPRDEQRDIPQALLRQKKPEHYVLDAGDVLGILPADEASGAGSAQREAALIELIVQMRTQARKSKNWAESDRLRDELAAIGVALEDRADGTVWKVNG